MYIELQTDHGDFVAVVEIAPLGKLPTVVTWKRRTFALHHELGRGGRAPIFREAFPYFVETTCEEGTDPKSPETSRTDASAPGRAASAGSGGLVEGHVVRDAMDGIFRAMGT